MQALYIWLFFNNKDIKFKELFLVVVKAEFIFLVVGIIKLVYLASSSDLTFEDIQYYQPLSALSIVGYDEIAAWFIYPLQILNLFELAYWILLAYLLARQVQVTVDNAFKVVLGSYGSALVIWVVFIMFLTLNNS